MKNIFKLVGRGYQEGIYFWKSPYWLFYKHGIEDLQGDIYVYYSFHFCKIGIRIAWWK